MKKKLITVFIAGIVLLVAGCAQNQGPSGAAAVQSPDSNIQIVKLGLDSQGYTPNPITVKANKPVRLIKDASLKGCAVFVVQDELGIKANLMNTDSYEFTPTTKGVYDFSCSMGMYKGVIQVV